MQGAVGQGRRDGYMYLATETETEAEAEAEAKTAAEAEEAEAENGGMHARTHLVRSMFGNLQNFEDESISR